MSTPAAEDPDPDINTPQGREEVARRTRLRWEEIAPFDEETGERALVSDWFRDSPEARYMLAEEVEKLLHEEETMVEFLLARIAEDEAVAAAAFCTAEVVTTGPIEGEWGEHVARHDPVRVVEECEAKRRIVERITDGCPHGLAAPTAEHPRRRVYPGGWCLEHCDAILRDLALPYVDHPDYRQEWKP